MNTLNKYIRKTVLLLGLIVPMLSFGQNNYYYTFDNNKIHLTPISGKYIVEFPNGISQSTQNGMIHGGGHPCQKINDKIYLVVDTNNLNNYSTNYKVFPTYLTQGDGEELYITSHILLKFKQSTSTTSRQTLISNHNLQLIKATSAYEMYSCANPLFTSQSIYESGLVEYCHPDFICPNVKPNAIPNDEYFAQQWYLHNTGQGTNDGNSTTNDADIDAPEAWDLSLGNSNIVVAVIDEGVTSNHPDLPNTRQVRLNGSNIASSVDGTPANDPSPVNSSYSGNNHGNSCAGVIAASHNNTIGISGIAPNCKIMSVRVAWGQSSSHYADAIIFAHNHGADIISNSWGGGSYSAAIVTAIEDAIDDGVIVVFAAGNTANHHINNNGFVSFPGNADIDNLITVGASDRNDNQANYSPTDIEFEIVAPSHTAYNSQISGEAFNIWTIDIPGDYGYNKWRDSWSNPLPNVGEFLPSTGSNALAYTGRFGGTSAACPQVSGVVALMLSVNPCLSPAQIKDLLQKTADKVGGYNYNWNLDIPGHSKELGYGRLNAYKAVKAAQDIYSLALDLYIRDKPNDMGIEPNPNTQLMWTSKDIWIRKNDDNGITHQNPEYKSNGNPNYIYVRVINKSCVASNGNEILNINWAKASTALTWPENWDGSLQNPGGYDLGGVLPISTIPILQPGEETIVKIPWVVPNPSNYSDNNEPWHFCLLARIDGIEDPLQPALSSVNAMAINDNNVAWTNITIVDLETEITGASVLVANPSYEQRTFFLELHKQVNEEGKAIFEEAEVSLKMDDILYSAWERGGKIVQKLDPTQEEKRKLVRGDNVILDHVVFNSKEMGLLTLDFNFLIKEITDKDEYTYHVVQKDANTGEIIGGETFIIRKKPRQVFMADAGNDEEIDKGESVTLAAEQINEAAKYSWYDSEGNLIYSGTSLSVSPEVTEKYKLEVVAEADGFKDYDEVQVKVNRFKITSLSPNPANTNVKIEYDVEGANSAYLMIVGASNFSTSNNYILNSTQTQTNIDVSNYQMGIYTVALVVDGQIVDAMALLIQ